MTLLSFVPEDSHCPKLLLLAAKSIVSGDSTTETVRKTKDSGLERTPVPELVAQTILDYGVKVLQDHGAEQEATKIDTDNSFLQLFAHGTTPLTALNVSSTYVRDDTLLSLLNVHATRLTTLSLAGCTLLTEELNAKILQMNIRLPNVHSLDLGSCTHLFTKWKASKHNKRSNRTKSHDSGNDSDTDNHLHPLTRAALDGSLFRSTTPYRYPQAARAISSLSTPADVYMRPDSSSANEDEAGRSSANSNSVVSPPLLCEPAPLCEHSAVIGMCCNLKRLLLHGDEDSDPQDNQELWAILLDPVLHSLVYIDASYWHFSGLHFLLSLRLSLDTLILHDVPDLYRCVSELKQLCNLRLLDVSQHDREKGTYPKPVTTLHSLVESLPHLRELDISSTNLASNPTTGDDDWPPHDVNAPFGHSDVVGLRNVKTKLKFLGLFGCDSTAEGPQLPAEEVAGESSEAQLLCAVERYRWRPTLLRLVLSATFHYYRTGESGCQYERALHLVLQALEGHRKLVAIQVPGTAALFYISRAHPSLAWHHKRRLLFVLLSALDMHTAELTLVRNCCLSLCHFEVPQDIMFCYKRMIRCLINVLEAHRSDTRTEGVEDEHMTQRIVIYLLNSMACQVDGVHKIIVGELGAIETILALITQRRSISVCDEVMEVSWSFLWNITDETPSNCARFLDGKGLDLFLSCFEHFPQKVELLRNMMGLMGNIAEVDSLRQQLRLGKYVTAFCALLDNTADGIEISYNSAGVLAHLCSDGPSQWIAVSPRYNDVQVKIIKATERWPMDARRFINYRSFEPIFRLILAYESPASQRWSIWALANLTTVDPIKYCPFIIDEGGLELLESLLSDSKPCLELKKLARKVQTNAMEFQRRRINEEMVELEAMERDIIVAMEAE